MNEVVQAFSHDFMQRALIVGIFISLCAAILGVSLVLKKYAMIGDGLSHVSFSALSIATVLNIAPLQFSLPIVVVVAFLLLQLNESSKIKGDSAIAIISAGSMAIGILVVSLTIGINIDINSYLFGNILAIDAQHVKICIFLATCTIILYLMYYKHIFAVTFDENFARATGIKDKYYTMLLAVLTAITIVVGMKVMGSLLISSLLIFPALSAMQIQKTFLSVVITATIISIICFIIGLVTSYLLASPIGATIVCVHLIVFTLCTILQYIFRKA